MGHFLESTTTTQQQHWLVRWAPFVYFILTMTLSQLGRYEVVGTLATGGMAEILLGRLIGPSGFERLVVIKRILPHFASLPEFRAMFLDEARIAASIRHDNVVQHHELGHADGELFLVMDYLEGETLSGVRRRARSRHIKVEPEMSAYIVGEACAGLHAAHELTTIDGVAQRVVHRDISPHNIFVTYEGTIKVIDFGIAKAASRVSHTEAGQLKGKFSYMSPEQARGEELDRRSDVFSMGIVLYELLSDRRLFRRATQASTLAAVLKGNIPSLLRVAPSCPKQLVAVTEQALAISREQRFESARAMRQSLLLAQGQLAPAATQQEVLADLMEALFQERREEKRAMVRRARERVSSSGVDIPPNEVDLDVEIPEVPLAASGSGSSSRTKTWLLVSALVGIIALGGLVTLYLSYRPTSTVAHTHHPVGAQPPERIDPEEVEIHFETDPPGALLKLAGEKRGLTPVVVRLPTSTEPMEATLSLDDHLPRTVSVSATTNQRIHFSLDPVPTQLEGSRPRAKTARSPRGKSSPAKGPGKADWSEVRF